MTRKQRNIINGWINLNKPLGISSAGAVNKAKWLLKPQKIGHAGTLDPLATGVLPLALGEGTKCINLLMDAKKTYEFAVTFGERRNTDDAEGEVIATSSHIPTVADIQSILSRFTGEILQTPPIYSALKIDGKRAYALARAGEEVELQPRKVTIHQLEFLGFAASTTASAVSLSLRERLGEGILCAGADNDLLAETQPSPNPLPQGEGSAEAPSSQNTNDKQSLTAYFRAQVSKGTYIRSLGRDIAQTLGSESYISRLHRSAVGPFTDAHAISLDFLEESVHKAPPSEGIPLWLTPLERALDDIPAVSIDGGQLTQLRHGQRVTLTEPQPDQPLIAVLHQEQLVALARTERNQVIPVRLLNVGA